MSAATASLARTRHAIDLQMGGALVAIGCRWRLISVPGVLGRLAKPSRLPSLLLSALAAVAPRRLQATRSEALAGAPWRTIDAT